MGHLLLLLLPLGLVAFLGGPGLALPPGPSGPPSRNGSSSHSLRFFYTTLSEPDTGMPQFVIVGYVDDQLVEKYDSNEQRLFPKAPWAEEAMKDVSQFWDRYTTCAKDAQAVFIKDLAILRDRYNQSGGNKQARAPSSSAPTSMQCISGM